MTPSIISYTSTSMVAASLVLASSTMFTHAFIPGPPAPLTRTPTTTVPSNHESTSLAAIRRGGGRRKNGGLKQKEFVPPMNNEIKHSSIRVNVSTLDGKDESLGVMTRDAALAKAAELGNLDLILVNANSDPPVCKIVDYSKFRYSQEKKRKEKAKNSKATEIKEVKMSYKIGDHDYQVRLKAASKFLKQGNRVKATVTFRGREVQHDKLGVELLKQLASDVEELGNMEGKPRREGRFLNAILTPRPSVVKAINDAKRTREREKKKSKEASLAKKLEAEEAKKNAAKLAAEWEQNTIGGVLEGLDLDLEGEFEDDDDDMDASLDELLGSTKVADDLFT